jgi:hypothetical protein
MKTCSKCKETKSIFEFTKQKQSKDGLDYWCKACKHTSDKTYRATPQGKINKINKSIRWRAKNPDKILVHRIVENAVRKGLLIKPKTCSTIGCNKPPVAHHPDYSKPLDVIWLCPEHHAKEH